MATALHTFAMSSSNSKPVNLSYAKHAILNLHAVTNIFFTIIVFVSSL